MISTRAPKGRFNMLGYGAIALYVAILAVLAAGVYGFNLTNLVPSLRASEETRARMRNGHMVITTEDRSQCRSMHFDNQTSELSTETLMDCDDAKAQDHSNPGGSFGMFRDGFLHR
jgi:hypothetical protein